MCGTKSGYRRSARTVRHKQDQAKSARAGVVLGHLIDRAGSGTVDLFYLDECGFAPSLPIGYSRSPPGRRKQVCYEYPQGRRVNVMATYQPFGPAPRLAATAFERSDDSLRAEPEIATLATAAAPPAERARGAVSGDRSRRGETAAGDRPTSAGRPWEGSWVMRRGPVSGTPPATRLLKRVRLGRTPTARGRR